MLDDERIRETFKTRKEADTRAAQIRQQRDNEGTAAPRSLPTEKRVEAVIRTSRNQGKTPDWQAGDFAYLGADTAELANWARAGLVNDEGDPHYSCRKSLTDWERSDTDCALRVLRLRVGVRGKWEIVV